MLINVYDVFLEILKSKNKYSYIKLHLITHMQLQQKSVEELLHSIQIFLYFNFSSSNILKQNSLSYYHW